MTQIATVERLIDKEHAEISVARKTACGHDCETCAGCGVMGYAIHAVAKNHIHAQPRDKVIVESNTRKVMNVVVLVYVLPFICFFVGYAVGHAGFHYGDAASGAVGARFFALVLIPAFFYNRYANRTGTLQYEILRLF